MVGTSSEMLLLFSYKHETAARLGITPQRLRRLRTRVSEHNYSEEAIVEMLSKLDCKCLLPKRVIPAVIKNNNGRIYTEDGFARQFFSKEFADKWRLPYERTKKELERGEYLSIPMLKHLLRSKGAYIIQERTTLESVWTYEPIDELFDDAKIVDIRRMLRIP